MNGVSLNAPKRITGNPVIGFMDKILTKKGEFHMENVNDSFSRGSDATAKEMPLLAEKGIKTILNLKTITKKEFKELTTEAQKNGMKYINIPLDPFRIKKSFPNIMQVLKESSAENPLFVHCTFGVDRTGFVSAMERYIKENLPMYKAIADMKQHGFDDLHRMTFFNMERFLRQFAKQNPLIK